MEQHTRKFQCELRADVGGRSIIGKIPYGSTADLGGFQEVLVRGCFSETLNSGRKVVALWGHDPNKPLANTSQGTLKLDDQPDGLHVVITPSAEISWGRDALLAAKRGDLGGLSFGFSIPKGGESWKGTLRTIHQAELHEISPCTWPAYAESTISVRQQSNFSERNLRMNNATTITKKNGLFHDENGQRLYVYTRAELDRLDKEYEERQQRYGDPSALDFTRAEVVDQPIYRGAAALGHQMTDIVTLSRSGSPGYDEARNRFDAMVKREKVLAEHRAAGTGGLVQAVGQDGGLLLQGETSLNLISNGFGNSAALSRASKRDLGGSQFLELIGIDETSRADGSRGGGVRVYTDKELDLLTQSKTKFDKIRLEPKRLTGMYFASAEILDNAPALGQEMDSLFNEEFAFRGQDLAIWGSGAGEALGVMNSPCLITVAAEVGQTPATITFQNLLKMKARIRIRNRNSLVWLANQDIEPQLYQIALPIGTGGAIIPAYTPSTNQSDGVAGMLMGHPIIFVEQCATLGTKGDIILGDWSSYVCADKGGIQSASSIHLKFDYNQTAFRFVTYFDGQPRIKAPITPFKGVNTVSPFVALATR